MKKHFLYFILVAFLSSGCTEEHPTVQPAAGDATTVSVPFCLETLVDTDTSLEPMTRATVYKERFYNSFRVLILKKIETHWVVDATRTVLFDPLQSAGSTLQLSEVPPCSFQFELRPGTYRFVAVIDWQTAVWNNMLTPGTVVADEADPSFFTPFLITYGFSTHPSNKGFRSLYREVFVAVAEVTVPKSEDLHDKPMQPVRLQARRRVAKFRLLLKDVPSPEKKLTFEETAHFAHLLFTSDKPIPEGIDALGNTYYSQEGLYELPWFMSTVAQFHTAPSGSYQLCQTNSTVFTPFLFADPVTEQPVEVSIIRINGASQGFVYKTAEVFTRTLKASRIVGIVFQTTDVYDDSSGERWVDVTQALADDGQAEDPAAIFDAFYEWNAEFN